MAQDPTPFRLARKGQRYVCPDGRDLLELAEAEGFSVSGVAEAMGLTNRQLEYAVERTCGLRPKELFRRHRMVLAKRFVAEGFPLQVIAQKLGSKLVPSSESSQRDSGWERRGQRAKMTRSPFPCKALRNSSSSSSQERSRRRCFRVSSAFLAIQFFL